MPHTKEVCNCICHDEGTWRQKEDVVSTHHKSQCPCVETKENWEVEWKKANIK